MFKIAGKNLYERKNSKNHPVFALYFIPKSKRMAFIPEFPFH